MPFIINLVVLCHICSKCSMFSCIAKRSRGHTTGPYKCAIL